MIDIEQYVGKLWTQSLTATPPPADLWVAPDIDVDTVKNLPALTWNIVGDGETEDGPGAVGIILNVNILGNGMDQAKDAARHVDDVAMAWFDDPWPTAITVDGDRIVVSDGDRIDMPTRIAEAMVEGRNLVQYSGSYRLLLRFN